MKPIFLAAALLAATSSASAFEVKPKVKKDAYSGDTVVWITPNGGACKIKDGGCLSVGWEWSSGKPDELQMDIQVLYVRSPITKGMVSIDGEEIPIRPMNELTSYDRPGDPLAMIGYSEKYFLVPFDIAVRMQKASRVWVFVETLEGSFRDRIRDAGKETKASGAIDRFLSAVSENRPPSASR